MISKGFIAPSNQLHEQSVVPEVSKWLWAFWDAFGPIGQKVVL